MHKYQSDFHKSYKYADNNIFLIQHQRDCTSMITTSLVIRTETTMIYIYIIVVPVITSEVVIIDLQSHMLVIF